MGSIPAEALIVNGCWSATLPSGSSRVAAPSTWRMSGQPAGVWVRRRAEAGFKATVAVSVLWPCGGVTVRMLDHPLPSHWKGAWQLPANDEKSCSGLPNAVCSVQATGVVVLTLQSRPHFAHCSEAGQPASGPRHSPRATSRMARPRLVSMRGLLGTG